MPIAKITGADVELGNFVSGLSAPHGTGAAASRAVLREIEGVPASGSECHGADTTHSDPQDLGRKYLPANGGCVYIDLDHIECAQPEVWSAYDHVAARHAMLRIVRVALDRANARLPHEYRVKVLVNNSDGHSHAYGSHLNFLVQRRTWNAIMRERAHYLAFLASHQASLLMLGGQGKVGSENGRPPVDYQIAQRADFLECLIGPQTTHDRPLVNTRDETLCGAGFGERRRPGDRNGEELARLHCIVFDSALSHTAIFLTVGTMQIVLAMLEAGEVPAGTLLADPLDAARTWSHDPTLSRRCFLAAGGRVTAVEHQLAVFDAAQRFAAGGRLSDVVPHAEDILGLWHETLSALLHRRFDDVAGRLDWVLKFHLLSRAAEPGGRPWWAQPRLRHLDQIYGSLDPQEGAYWAYEAAGIAEQLVSSDRIREFVEQPPADTRAWTRAHLLRLAEPERIVGIDWDEVSIETVSSLIATVRLFDPRDFGRVQESWLPGGAATVEDALARLGSVVDYETGTQRRIRSWGREGSIHGS